MRLAGSIALFRYWNRLRGRRAAPNRSEIRPAQIKTLLADTFILERDQTDRVRFRLAGTRICAAFGKELKGTAFTALWAGKDRQRVEKLTRSAFDAKFALVASFEGITGAGQKARFELLLLPLDGHENPRALGSILPREEPFWLGVDAITEARLLTSRIIEADHEALSSGERPSVSAPPLAPVGEPTSASGRERAAGRRFHHLVIFDGGRED